jgi:hypothetical protein
MGLRVQGAGWLPYCLIQAERDQAIPASQLNMRIGCD